MKPKELIELLQKLPEDAEVVVNGYNDDILGYYYFTDKITVIKQTAVVDSRGSFKYTISNDVDLDKVEEKTVYLLD
jgi:hypothetical protein